MKRKIWSTLLLFIGILPLGYIIPFLSFYIHATFLLGHFPFHGQSGPEILDIYPVYTQIISIGGNIWLFSFPVWLLLTSLMIIVQKGSSNWRFIFIGLFGQVVALLLFFLQMVEWFAD